MTAAIRSAASPLMGYLLLSKQTRLARELGSKLECVKVQITPMMLM